MTDHTPWCDHKHPDTDDGTGATPCHSRPVMLWPGAAAWLRSPSYPSDSPAVIVDNRDGTQTTWDLAEFRQMLWAGIELCATANLGTWPAPDPGPAPHTEAERNWWLPLVWHVCPACGCSPGTAHAADCPDPHTSARQEFDRSVLDVVKTTDQGMMTRDEFEARGGVLIDPASISLPKAEAFARGENWPDAAEQAAALVADANPTELRAGAAELAAAAIPIVVDDQPTTPDLLQALQDSVDRAKAGRPVTLAPHQICTCSFLPDPHVWGASCPMTGHL